MIFLALIAVDGLVIEKPSTNPFQLPNLKSDSVTITGQSGVLSRVNPFGKGANLIVNEPVKYKLSAFGSTPKPQQQPIKPKTTKTTSTTKRYVAPTTTTQRYISPTTTTRKPTTKYIAPTTTTTPRPKSTTPKYIVVRTTPKPRVTTPLKIKPTTTKPHNYTPSKIVKPVYYHSPGGFSKDSLSKTLKQDHKIRNDGSYKYEFETENGIMAQEEGKQKEINGESGAEAQGEFSYVAPDGQVITMHYIANEAGFQPVGDHIPTPPPMPDSVVRLLAFLKKNAKQSL